MLLTVFVIFTKIDSSDISLFFSSLKEVSVSLLSLLLPSVFTKQAASKWPPSQSVNFKANKKCKSITNNAFEYNTENDYIYIT